MRFNAKSVTLNRGVNYRAGIEIPPTLLHYSIPADVWDKSIEDFNKQLDTRRQVSEIVDGVKVDVLRINRSGGGLFIWMMVKNDDVETIEKVRFTFKGKLVFENEHRIEQVIINDLLYGERAKEKSIFRKELTT